MVVRCGAMAAELTKIQMYLTLTLRQMNWLMMEVREQFNLCIINHDGRKGEKRKCINQKTIIILNLHI